MDAVSCSDFFCYLLSKTTTKKHVLSTKQEKFVFFLMGTTVPIMLWVMPAKNKQT